MIVEILVGEGCTSVQITNAFKELKANPKGKAFNSTQFDINLKSILSFMERENYHKAFKLTADSQKALFPMETITDEDIIFSTRGKISFNFIGNGELLRKQLKYAVRNGQYCCQ